MSNMYALVAEQATNFGDVAIALGGSIIVGVFSVLAIIVANNSTTKMKKNDYRQQELNHLAEAISSARKALGRLSTTIKQIGSLDEKLREEKPINFELIEENVRGLNEEVHIAEAALIRVYISNPHADMREEVGKTIDAIIEATSVGIYDQLSKRGAQPSHSEAVHFSKLAAEQLDSLRDKVSATYYPQTRKKKPQ